MKTVFKVFAALLLCAAAAACNQDEIQSLLASSNEQAGSIATITEQVDNINASIAELKKVDAEITTALANLQAEDTAIRSQLEADKLCIEASIDSLEAYVNEQLQAARDWAIATFATLAQYNDLCDSLAAVGQNLAELDERLTSQLKHSIDTLQSSMKKWVNEQLANYYTIAEMDAELSALEKAIQDGDEANAEAIAQLQKDLAQQAADLTAAYESAISSAIEESNGVLNKKITDEIASVNTRIDNEVKTLGDRIDALEQRIQAVEDYINSQKNFAITFTMPKDTVCFPGETIKVEYEVTESTLPTIIECIPDDGWKAVVKPDGNKGVISITAPTTGGDGKVVVFANRSTWTLMSTLSFEEGVLSIAKDEYPAPAEGGILEIPFSINAGYGIKIADADKSWIRVNETKAAMRDETLSLTIAANPDQSIRLGKIYIYPEEGDNDEYYELKINQASAFFSVSTTGFVIGGDVASKEITVTSSLPFDIVIPDESDWLSAVAESIGGNDYKVTFSFNVNNGETRRTADVAFISKDGTTRYGSVAIIQDTRSEEDISAMIFEVRANVANDYTVYLPISIVSNIDNSSSTTLLDGCVLDCYIDWGDGEIDHYVQDSGWGMSISHHYDIEEATTYQVGVNGIVPCLCAEYIPENYKGAIVSVCQWGKTGLRSLGGAFKGCTNLASIPGDDSGSFSDVIYFTAAFLGCSRLNSIPDNLFSFCNNVIDYNETFMGCTNLHSIPHFLFSKSSMVLSFNHTFSGCKGISSIPGSLFAACNRAKNFLGTFESSGITDIPESLFSNCGDATGFQSTFAYCTQISDVPALLFAHNPRAQSFSATFLGCKLKAVPTSLFDNNRRVTYFFETFSYNSNLSGESPYSIINGEKVHLYERHLYPDVFVTPSTTDYCFAGDLELSDYSDIPASWK